MTRSRNTADTQTASGGPVSPGIAGKNAVINGGMDIWQRGTSIAISSAGVATYASDRWFNARTVAGQTVSRQATGDTTNLPFIQYCARVQRDSGNTNTTQPIRINQLLETVNSIPLAGRTVTLSFYARAGANFSAASSLLTAQLISGTGTDQNVLSGGYTGIAYPISGQVTLTTTWQRFSITGTVAATATELSVNIYHETVGTAGAADYFEITGVQLELGSTATPFSRAQGTTQGELAACQRYYFRTQTGTGTPYMAVTVAGSSTTTYVNLIHKVTMRTTPTSVDFSAIKWQAINNSGNISTASISDATPENTLLVCTTTGATVAQMNYVIGQTTSGYIGVSAEL